MTTETRRLVVVSDLHVGLDGDYNIFAGTQEFGAFTATLGAGDHLVLNGDAFDFLLDAEPMEMERAVQRAQKIVAGTEGIVVTTGLRELLVRGGRVTIRCGNHDPETGLAAVEPLLRSAIGNGLVIDRSDVATYEIAGTRVAVAHGEASDDWNRFEHDAIERADFTYPPGSRLVKSLLNPAKDEGLKFVDLLKPDVEGALLAVLAVRPSMVSRIATGESAGILWQLGKRMRGTPTAAVRSVARQGALARLDPDAADALGRWLDDGIGAKTRGVLGSRGFGAPDRATRAKWLRAGLFVWARLQKAAASDAGDEYFDIVPGNDEWEQARELSAGHDADIVLLGHTHAARFLAFDGLVFANTGTWIPLMRLPNADAPIDEWESLLADLEADPDLDSDAEHRKFERLTFVEIDGRSGTTRAALKEWRGTNALEIAAHGLAPAATTRGAPRRVAAALPRDATHAATRSVTRGGPRSAAAIATSTPLQPRIDRLARELDAWAQRNPAITFEVLTSQAHLVALIEQTRNLLADASRASEIDGLDLLADAETAWNFYRYADAQRRDPELGARLQIADAIAFDGYRVVMERARVAKIVTGTRLPVPLVYLEPGPGPATTSRGAQLRGLTLTGPARRTVAPFPVILLPHDHLETPWWLTVLLHEVGHDLDADLELEPRLAPALAKALEGSPRRDAWLRWLPEIIADLSGVRLGGPQFAVSLHELATLVGATSWYTTGEHPPLALRMELARALLGEAMPDVPAWPWAPAQLPYRDEVAQVIATLSAVPIGELTMSELFDDRPQEPTWRRLPGLIQEQVNRGASISAANLELDRRAQELEPPSWKVDTDYRRFLREMVPRLAPTILEPGSTYKIPPLSLLTIFDEAWFVGVTNGQLADRIEQAYRDRGRGWDRLVFFFLDDSGIERVALDPNDAAKLREERDAAWTRLEALSQEYAAHPPALRKTSHTFFFASFWRRSGERRVHVSAKIPGQDIRTCPAIDYRAVEGQSNPALEDYFAGLERLCAEQGLAQLA